MHHIADVRLRDSFMRAAGSRQLRWPRSVAHS